MYMVFKILFLEGRNFSPFYKDLIFCYVKRPHCGIIETHLFIVVQLQVSCLCSILTPTPSQPTPQSISPIVCARESSICLLLLAPSPSFLHYPPPPITSGHCQFFISKSLVLFCSFVVVVVD